MKHSIKIASLMAYSALFAGGTAYATQEQSMSQREASAPQGVMVNRAGEVMQSYTKAMVDEDRPVGGTSIRYFSSSAAGMQTISSTPYNYAGGGCSISTAAGSYNLDEAIDLPDGSKIISYTAMGNDISTVSSAVVYLSKVDETGSYTIIDSDSSGTTDQPGRFSLGGYLNHDMLLSEGLLIRLYASDTDIELCGFRIGYVPPDVAGDVIFVNNFYR